jgi:hypothetical protein
MPTITKAFSEMYGNGKPLNYKGVNVSANNMLKNIVPNQTFNNNNGGEPLNVGSNTGIKNSIVSEPMNIPYKLIFFILLIIGIIAVLYFYREKIYALMDKLTSLGDVDTKIQDSIKKYDTELQEKNIKEKEIEEKIKNENVKKGAVNELSTKLDTASNYKQEQLVKENSFCYIGYESGQRECTNVFDGDICMSGEIFPKMDICINPRLRP